MKIRTATRVSQSPSTALDVQDGPTPPPVRTAAWMAGYRACNKALLVRPGTRLPGRPGAALRRRWANNWTQFCKGWAQRMADKQKADLEW